MVLEQTLQELETFADISGLKTNFDKTEVVWIGAKKYSTDSIKTRWKLSWGTTQFRLLGITFNVDLSKIIEVNYNDKIIQTRSGSRWHAIANPQASGRNCPCTTQHGFKQPGKILLVCYSTHHSLQFDMPHDHVVRNLIFDPAPAPKSHPKGCSWGHKVNPVQYVLHLSLLSICAHFRIKIFKIDFEIGNC